MTIDIQNNNPRRRGSSALARGIGVIAGLTMMGAGLFQIRDGLRDLFPSWGANANLSAAATKAVSAADRFATLGKDAYQTGKPPRETDPSVKQLLDGVFDVTILKTGQAFTKSDLPALADWALAAGKAGNVYIFSGTGLADPSQLATKAAADPNLGQRVDLNAAAFAPEIGQYMDAELTIGGAVAEVVTSGADATASNAPQQVMDGLNKIRAGLSETIESVITTFPVEGINDSWRRDRLAALEPVAPSASKLLTSAQCDDLRNTTQAVDATMNDAMVKNGLEGFAAALKCANR